MFNRLNGINNKTISDVLQSKIDQSAVDLTALFLDFSTFDQERSVLLIIDFPNRIVASLENGDFAYRTVGALTLQKDNYEKR